MKKYKIDNVDVAFFSNGMVIYWKDLNGLYFGSISITKRADGSIYIDDEYMSKEFVKAVFNAFIEEYYKK